MKTALVFGATGFIGSYLLEELLNGSDYDCVTAVTRKPMQTKHPKLTNLIGDYNSLSAIRSRLIADDVFIVIGTTKANTPDESLYYQIDHDYPVLAAKFAKENGAKSVFLVTSVGADANSKFFYTKTKGETERDVRALNYGSTNIFRPSMLMGSRKEHRQLESILITAWSLLNLVLVGSFSQYKGIDGKDVARAMANSAKAPPQGVKIYHWDEMSALL
ncbi:MAG: NAD(P)H-binding protein [Bryobacteraceae bacterium]